MKSDENTQYYQGFPVQDGGKSTAICLLLILIPFISVKKKIPFYQLETTIMKTKNKKKKKEEEEEKVEEKKAIARLIKQQDKGVFPWISEKPKADGIISIKQSRENSYKTTFKEKSYSRVGK